MGSEHGSGSTAEPVYRRVLLKLSGEALMGGKSYGLDTATLDQFAGEIAAVCRMGVQVAVVVGGGNIFRGVSSAADGMERTNADYMGMLATVINALAVQGAMERQGVPAFVQSAIAMEPICERYDRRAAVAHLESGAVVIFAAGTGNPFFTTDTAAALRAVEMACSALLKGTQVDGVYSADPKKDPTATRYERLTYQEVLARDLRVLDGAAVALGRDNRLPIVVFSIHTPGALADVVAGRGLATVIE